MADHNDKSLLERLNALKPTNVSLDTTSNALNIPATAIQPAEPPSREDALSKRLKSLREQPDSGNQPAPEGPPPPYAEIEGQGDSAKQAQTLPPSAQEGVAGTESRKSTLAGLSGDVQDDRSLDEILGDLVLEDDHWSISEDGGEDDSKKVEQLLAKLAEKPPPSDGHQSQDAEGAAGNDDDEDDSEGEEMSRKVNAVLARTLDEVTLEGGNDQNEPVSAAEHVDTTWRVKVGASADDSPKDTKEPQDSELTLPEVPQTPTQEQPPLPDLPATPQDQKQDPTGLSLPAVPTILQDPVPPSRAGDPFESSIEARLAALKGPGHKPISTDSFGLPSAPTFQPEENRGGAAGSGSDSAWRRSAGKAGYTDDDQGTWCTVCLEDATVRCVGCGGDVYCARCWREMHVGPAAGYDERGHRWEKFDPRRL